MYWSIVQPRRDGVDDQVEVPASFSKVVGVAGGVVVVGTERQPVLLLRQRLGEDRDLRAERMGDLHTDVSESAEADDGDLAAGADVPVLERRVQGDAGTQQRRNLLKFRDSGTFSTKSSLTTMASE